MQVFRIMLLWIFLAFKFLYADGEDVSIAITDASGVYESNESKLRFTIQLSQAPWLGSVTVNYSTTDGTAKAGQDYSSTSGSVTFYLYQSSKTVEVPIIDNNIHEGSEYLYMNITCNENGYSVTRKRGVGYIYDNDEAPLEARIYNRYENEKDSNWVLNFTIKLSKYTTENITLKYRTIANTAVAGKDYIEANGTITIPKGSIYGYIPITIVGDDIPEGRENFYVKISSISKGTITSDTATGTIVDDDAVKVYMEGQDVSEGDSGDNNRMRFKIYLAKEYPLDSPLTIHYETQDGSSAPSATAGSDYKKKSGNITFSKGDKEKFVYVDIIGDDEIEKHEFLQMNLSGSTAIVTTKAQALILNDDGTYPSISISSTKYSVIEGNNSQGILKIIFALDKPALEGSSLHYETYDDTAQDERGDNDYIYTHGDKILDKGVTGFAISIPINGDTKIEEDESFYFTISNLSKLNYGTTNKAKITILNDDGSYPTLSFTQNTFTVAEGNSSTRDINFTLSLDLPAFEESYFDYYTRNGSALGGEDFVTIKRQRFNIPKGEQNITIPVTINGDTDIENDEEFYLIIGNQSKNLKLSGTQSPKGIILNDDGSFPEISIEQSSYSIVERNSTSRTITIKLLLDKPALDKTQIEYYTEDVDAQDGSTPTEDSDYIESRGTLNIKTGVTSVNIDITINGDTYIEPNENFKLNLKNGKNLTIGRATTTITILNDDEHNEGEFECDKHMYLSSSIKRGSQVTGKMWLHKIDISKSPFGFDVLDDNGEDKLYNALAYNEKDNYIYALYYKELFKISKTGKVMSLGEVKGLPDILENKQAYAGASYNGYYYVTGFGVDYDKLYKIKLSESDENRTVEEITLTTAVSIKDFSFSPTGRYLYGIADGGKLTKIDVSSGEVTFIGKPHTGYEFDSSFSDRNGRFFANDSRGNGFFEFNLENGTKRFLSDSQPANFNDGTNCINAELLFTDYGDAPNSNGKYYGDAWHSIIGGIYLGDKVDHDTHSYANKGAMGDDTNGTDDEDGVTLPDGTPLNGAYLEDNRTQQLKVKLSKEASLRVWIDLDIDGHFDNKDDLVYDKRLTGGVHTINIALPAGLKHGVTTYLRARVSSAYNMDYYGYIPDGEVEDYAIKFGSATQPLRGVFNVERTDSGSFPIASHERDAWFTQIVGRDFDYSLLFYEKDMSQEKELDNVTLKIELINEDTNVSMYEMYTYIKNDKPKSRIDYLSKNDLNSLPATKRAIFKVSYGVNDDGSILQAPCVGEPMVCFEKLPNVASMYARDDFAIRPEYFHMIISDGNRTLRVNTAPHNRTPLRLTAGYDYNLSVTASAFHGNDTNPSLGYTTTATRILKFLDRANPNAVVKNDVNGTDIFVDGRDTTKLLELQEVGRYLLKFVDSNWAKVDSDKGDCNRSGSYTSANGNVISGCSTVSSPDINLTLYPHHFDINLSIQNLPNSSHDDFIYMSEINSTFNSMAVVYQGKVTAKSRNGTSMQNFNSGYMAEDTLFNLDVSTLSDNGINQPIQTTDGTPVEFIRITKFNSDTNVRVDRNSTFKNLPVINISKSKFDRNGSVTLDLRYNISKNLSETTNPIQITFQSADVNSSGSYSLSYGHNNRNPYVPKGTQDLGDEVRNFYFAQIAPDKINYPMINFNKWNFIRTPMQVEIFCGKVSNQYCRDTNLTNHVDITSSPRSEQGWFLSIDHNGTVDGGVRGLSVVNRNSNALIFTTSTTPIFPMELPNGRNGTLVTRFADRTREQKYKIDIFVDPPFMYCSNGSQGGVNYYIVSGSDDNKSTWSGVGRTGRVLELKANGKKNHKMDW